MILLFNGLTINTMSLKMFSREQAAKYSDFIETIRMIMLKIWDHP